MGGGLSKHEDEMRAEQEHRELPSAVPTLDKAIEVAASDAYGVTNESRCPMKRGDGSYTFDWWKVLTCPQFPHGPSGKKPIAEEEVRQLVQDGVPSSSQSVLNVSNGTGSDQCPVSHDNARKEDGCPVKHSEYNVYSQPIDPKNNMPKIANQLPAPGQSKELPTERVHSTIPKGGTDNSTWTYPSPQMFYNALARKGKLGDTDEEDIISVVALHNNMNEKTWQKVLEWEKVLCANSATLPKLLRFQGRPSDLSPKAAFKHYVLGHPMPYDRHDWTVLRADGTTVRYVIDYYHDDTKARDEASSALPELSDAEATPSLLVDVRPALDSPVQLYNRVLAMPYARRVADTTPFEPLPMRPTETMRSQVSESVQVWESIQATARKKFQEPENEEAERLSSKDAKKLAASFSKMLKECRTEQHAIDHCESEKECSKASVDLTICMAKIVCPIQHQALVKTVMNDDESVTEEESEAKVEAILAAVHDCVVLKTGQQRAAKEQYPHMFTNKQ